MYIRILIWQQRLFSIPFTSLMIDQQVKRIPSKKKKKKNENKLKGISLVKARAILEPNATFPWITYFFSLDADFPTFVMI